MKKIFLSALIFSLLAPSVHATINNASLAASVLKLKTYTTDPMSGNYTFTQWGSAVMLDSTHVITNAHVILDDSSQTPTGLYEICASEQAKKDPVCFSTAKLISYDTVADLALLEIENPSLNLPVPAFSDKDMSIGSSVIVYGYPDIGGSTITRTEGKIGGNTDNAYKFDGTIDHGNSGG